MKNNIIIQYNILYYYYYYDSLATFFSYRFILYTLVSVCISETMHRYFSGLGWCTASSRHMSHVAASTAGSTTSY